MRDDYVPISQLNAYCFCPRRFYYEHVLGEWRENEHTLRGTIRHERAHAPGQESRPERLETRAVAVHSDRLRIVGRLDVLEERSGALTPVEYKSGRRGPRGAWRNDAVQLCALALCLEEQTGERIEAGVLFTFEDRARTKVRFDEALRAETERVIAEAHALADSPIIPPPVYSRRCEGCSLKPLCLPQEVNRLRARPAQRDSLRALAAEGAKGLPRAQRR